MSIKTLLVSIVFSYGVSAWLVAQPGNSVQALINQNPRQAVLDWAYAGDLPSLKFAVETQGAEIYVLGRPSSCTGEYQQPYDRYDMFRTSVCDPQGSPFTLSVLAGKPEVLQYLLNRPATGNKVVKARITALSTAILYNQTSCLDALLRTYTARQMYADSMFYRTVSLDPVALAAEHGDLPILQKVLTWIHNSYPGYFGGQTLLALALEGGSVEVVDYLYQSPKIRLQDEPWVRARLVRRLAEKGDLQMLEHLRTQHLWEIFQWKEEDGENLLHIAAETNNVQLAKYLLEGGTSPNAVDALFLPKPRPDGTELQALSNITPLKLAKALNNQAVAEYLQQQGVNE